MKRTKLLSLAMVALLMGITGTSIRAEESNTEATEQKEEVKENTSSTYANSESYTIPVTGSIQAMKFSVTVPMQLPIYLDADGNVTTSTTAEFINNSDMNIGVTDIEVIPKNNWEITSYSGSLTQDDIDKKKVGFKINGAETVNDEFQFMQEMESSNFNIPANGSLPIEYDAVIPVQKTPISNEGIADIIFTVDWHCDNDYRLTINYKDETGGELSPSIINYYNAGDTFSIDSPVIDGLEANMVTVTNPNGGMPRRNLTYDVAYSKLPPIVNGFETSITEINPPVSQGFYRVGNEAEFEVKITNNSSRPAKNIVLTPNFSQSTGIMKWKPHTAGNVDTHNNFVIGGLSAGETVNIGYTYTPVREQALHGKWNEITNSIAVSCDNASISIEGEPITVEQIYKFQINYKYDDGREASPSVIAYYLEGETFGYTSPTIPDYTPDFAFVRTGGAGMPDQDTTVKVTYSKNAPPIVTVNYHGDGATTLNQDNVAGKDIIYTQTFKMDDTNYPNGLMDAVRVKKDYYNVSNNLWKVGSSTSYHTIDSKQAYTGIELAKALGITDTTKDTNIEVYP